jgi:hypothetical protein
MTTCSWLTFDDFVKCAFSVRKITLDRTNWRKSTCTCPTYFKKYLCKHVIGLALIHKQFAVRMAAKNQPLGTKRGRGRPALAVLALHRQTEIHASLFDADVEVEAENADPEPSTGPGDYGSDQTDPFFYGHYSTTEARMLPALPSVNPTESDSTLIISSAGPTTDDFERFISGLQNSQPLENIDSTHLEAILSDVMRENFAVIASVAGSIVNGSGSIVNGSGSIVNGSGSIVSGSSVSGASSHLMSLDNLIAPLPPNIMKPQGSKRGRPKLTDEEKNERAAARKKAKQTI